MDITTASLLALNVAINTSFNTTLTGVETSWNKVAMSVPSSGAGNTYPKLSELPAMREWLGPRVINRLDTDGFTLLNRTFENTVAIPVNALEDDQYGVYMPMISDLGQTVAELPDDLVWEQLMKGFDTAHFDGQNFFDTDHPVEDADGVEQSVSNYIAGVGDAWFLMDTTRAIKPLIFQDRSNRGIVPKTDLTSENVFNEDEFVWGAKRRGAAGFGAWQLVVGSKAALTPENYALARKMMLEMRGHGGRKLSLKPNLLVVNASNEGAAREILLNERDAAGATNKWRNTAELHVETRI